MTMLKM